MNYRIPAVAAFIVGLVRTEAESTRSSLDLSRIAQFLDYTEYGGAPLLGVNGVSIICHGSSSANAIKNAIRVAVQAVESGLSLLRRVVQGRLDIVGLELGRRSEGGENSGEGAARARLDGRGGHASWLR